MKILLTGLAFSAGFVISELVDKNQMEGIVVTAPVQTITKWDTVHRIDTMYQIDTVFTFTSECEKNVKELERDLKRKRRDCDEWNSAYQKLRRKNPAAAAAFSEILINRK